MTLFRSVDGPCGIALGVVLFALCGGLALAPGVRAGETSLQAQWDFSENLFLEKDYFRAITEYKRFLFHFPGDARADLVRARIVESYARGQWWSEGNRAAGELLERGITGELRARILLIQGICRMRMDLLPDARGAFREAIRESGDPGLWGRAEFLLGETYGRAGEWEDAAQTLERVEVQSGLGGAGDRGARRIREAVPLPEKSPWVAGLLAAVMPGAGHAYSGRWKDAGLVFAVNAAFTGAAVEAFQRENYPLAGGLALVELLWYSGNIFSAVGSVHKHNRALNRNLWEEIQLPWEEGEKLPGVRAGRGGPEP